MKKFIANKSKNNVYPENLTGVLSKEVSLILTGEYTKKKYSLGDKKYGIGKYIVSKVNGSFENGFCEIEKIIGEDTGSKSVKRIINIYDEILEENIGKASTISSQIFKKELYRDKLKISIDFLNIYRGNVLKDAKKINIRGLIKPYNFYSSIDIVDFYNQCEFEHSLNNFSNTDNDFMSKRDFITLYSENLVKNYPSISQKELIIEISPLLEEEKQKL